MPYRQATGHVSGVRWRDRVGGGPQRDGPLLRGDCRYASTSARELVQRPELLLSSPHSVLPTRSSSNLHSPL